MNRIFPLCLFLLAIAAFGCGPRKHIHEDYGKSYQSIFNTQQLARGDTTRSPAPMRADEARGIHTTYTKQFSSCDGAQEGTFDNLAATNWMETDMGSSSNNDRRIELSGE